MSKNKSNDRKSKSSLLFESKDLKIYTDLNQAAEAEALYTLRQDPIERIRETVKLILRVYPLSEKKANSNKIFIDKS